MGSRSARLLAPICVLSLLAAGVVVAESAGVGMSFVPNLGQAEGELQWLAHAPGASVGFAENRVSLALPSHGRTVEMAFVGTHGPSVFEGVDPLPGRANYFLGADSGAWHSDVPTYGGLALRELYDGVDVRFEGSETALKGTFVLSPGADPAQIRWRYAGIDALHLKEGGNLSLAAGRAALQETAPIAWQEYGGERVPVGVEYQLADDGMVGFALGAYDLGLPLVIDPYLEWTTLVGGGAAEEGRDIVVDAAGNAYVTGSTRSSDLPGAGPPQGSYAGPFTPSNLGDAFIFKLAPDGKTVLFMTYLGGSDEEVADGIALGPDGSIVVAGTTESTDFPTVSPIQAAQGGQDCSSAPCNDLFIAKLNAAGNSLSFSTYLGGSRDESAGLIDFGTRQNAVGVDVDTAGSIYVVGTSDSTDFPVVNAFQSTRAGLGDLVLVKLRADGGQLLYSSYLGGTGAEYSGDVAVDDMGRAWVVGGTLSSSFPTRNAFDADKNPLADVVVARFDTTKIGGSSLLASTYLGGSNAEMAFGVAVGGADTAYITGYTGSDDFPLMSAFQTTNGSSGEPSPRDGFLAVLDDGGSTLAYSTFFGGSGRDLAYDLDVSGDGTVVVGGTTSSDDLPVRLAYQAFRRQGIDLFVARFDPTRAGASSLVSASYLGGEDSEALYGIAADSADSVFVTGLTGGVVSDTFPVDTTIGANGTTDGVLVAKLRPRAQYWMLVGSRAFGLNDSIWRTDIGLMNPESEDANVEVRFHDAAGVVSKTWVVAAGAQLILEDAVGQLGGSQNGAIEVITDREVKVTSRTYNLVATTATCSPGGTLGQSFGSYTVREALLAGESAWLPQLTETPAYRTNIAVTNTGVASAKVEVRLFDGSGTFLTSTIVDLEPGQWKQLNRPFFDLAGKSNLASGYAKVEVEEGSGIIAIGSVVDNITNDPTTIPMIEVDAAGFENTWVLVGSHADGANNSTWRTDLAILNVSGRNAVVTVRLHTPGGVLSQDVQVASGDQVLITDLVGQVPYTGSAAIELAADRKVVISSRTYNRVGPNEACFANGTLGQALAGNRADGGLSTGESAWLTQLTENGAYRTNIALTNTGTTTATVTVRMFNGAGSEVGSYVVTVAPGEWKQENRPFFNRAGLSDLGAAYAQVTVDSGSGVLAIASVVNNVTNDPTTIVPGL